jgi:hypothetical protein
MMSVDQRFDADDVCIPIQTHREHGDFAHVLHKIELLEIDVKVENEQVLCLQCMYLCVRRRVPVSVCMSAYRIRKCARACICTS